MLAALVAAAATISPCSAASSSTRRHAIRKSSGAPGATTTPAPVSRRNGPISPTSVATTGTRTATASRIAIGSPSPVDGKTATSATRKTDGTLSYVPRKIAQSAESSSASALTDSSSGPSPAKTTRTSPSSSRSAATVRSVKSWRFCGAKRATWATTFALAGMPSDSRVRPCTERDSIA